MSGGIAGVGRVIAAPVNAVVGHLNKKQERRQAREVATAKIEQSKVDGKIQVQITDQEWEALKVSQEGETWKDEYVTVVITTPILLFFVGGIAHAFGYPELLEGVNTGIAAIQGLNVDFGSLMETVVYAAVGVKVVKKFL
jgi:hypothetical protein